MSSILDINNLISNRFYRLISNAGYFVRDVQFLGLAGSVVPGVSQAQFYDPVRREYHYISNGDIWRSDNCVKIIPM